MVSSRARAGYNMFITCNVVSVPTKITKLGENLICVRESVQGTSCKTQKKYGCGVGEKTLKKYGGEIASTAKTQGCFAERDEKILKERGVEIFKMNGEGTMIVNTGKEIDDCEQKKV
uniref:Uncharacterized protein n=1 Tax=Strongyloides venezuelensis TaxID=75913 RepID=A0A0K0EVZ4_STRVS